MDDQRFDDNIKRKVGEFEDPGFDPADLAALHHQLRTVSAWPWYEQYRTELMLASGLALCTLIVVWSQWFMSSHVTESLKEKIMTLQGQQAEIDRLQQEVAALKNTPPDTMRIIEIRERPTSHYASLLHRIRSLESAMNSKVSKENTGGTKSKSDKAILSYNEEFARTPFAPGDDPSYRSSFPARLWPKMQEQPSLRAEPDAEAEGMRSTAPDLSPKTLRDLEKHYQTGIGIRVGPVLEISRGFYEVGSGKFDVTAGVLADFVLSPSLSLETGAKYVHRVYNVADKRLFLVQWPGIDESLGTLESIDVDSWIFEIPVSLKYRYPVSVKSHWIASIGYSSLLYKSQVLEYEYEMVSNPLATISSAYRNSHTKVYPGLLNFSLGVSKQLRNGKLVETSVYYQHGLGETGIEQSKPNFLGVRGVYWFTVK
jgi:hypothetical protein